jgi:hypothetical protein
LFLLWSAVLGIGAVAACADELTRPQPQLATSVSEGVPALVMTRLTESSIENRYIVRLRDDVPSVRVVAAELAQLEGRALHFLYEYTIRGFAATLPPNVVDEVRRHPQVTGVYPDARIEGGWAAPRWGRVRLIVGSGVQVDTAISDSITTFCDPNCPEFQDPPGDTLSPLPLGIDR